MTTDASGWLTAARDRANNATEGPWRTDIARDGCIVVIGPQKPGSPQHEHWLIDGDVSNMHDARFIQHARTEHPAMAAALTAVLDLHHSQPPTPSQPWGACAGCTNGIAWTACPTVRAIAEHLEAIE